MQTQRLGSIPQQPAIVLFFANRFRITRAMLAKSIYIEFEVLRNEFFDLDPGNCRHGAFVATRARTVELMQRELRLGKS